VEVVEVVDVGVLDVVVDVGVVVEVVDVDVVAEVGQFAIVVGVVVDDVVVAPVLPVFVALAVSAEDPVDDAPAPLSPASGASATAPMRVTIRSAPTLRLRNLTDPPPIACHKCPTANSKMSTSRRVS